MLSQKIKKNDKFRDTALILQAKKKRSIKVLFFINLYFSDLNIILVLFLLNIASQKYKMRQNQVSLQHLTK